MKPDENHNGLTKARAASRVPAGGRLRYLLVAAVRDPARRTLACLISRDNCSSWSDHAAASREFSGNYATGGARAITADGHVIGSFTERVRFGGYGKGVWFYRIKAR